MARRWKNTLSPEDATPEAHYLNRRAILAGMAGMGLAAAKPAQASTEELVPNPWEDITQYNNFYEFGTRKDDPFNNAHRLTTEPWSVTIDGLVEPPKSEWNVELASHRMLTPMLIFSTLANALKASSSDQTDVMFTATYTVTIDGLDPITLTDRGYMGSGPADIRALSHLRLFDLMEIAYGNAFERTRLTNIELDLDVTFGDETLTIVEATVPATEVDPGSTVDVRLRLRRYDETEVIRTIPVRIPERLAGEDVKIELNAGSRVGVEHAVPRSIQDLVQRVRESYDATEVVAELKMPSRGLRFPGHVVRSLPRSALDALDREGGTSPGRPFVTQVRQAADLGHVVVGDAELTLSVRERPRRR